MNESRFLSRSKMGRLRPLLFLCVLLVAFSLWNPFRRAESPGVLAQQGSSLAANASEGPRLAQPSSTRLRTPTLSEPLVSSAPIAGDENPALEPATGELRGFVYSSRGDRLLGNKVWIQDEDFHRASFSDLNGEFAFGELPPGTYGVHLLARARLFPCSIEASRTVRVVAGETAVIDLYMDERLLIAEIQFEDEEESSGPQGGVDQRKITLTPHQPLAHPTLQATFELMSAKHLRAKIGELSSDEEMDLRPEQNPQLQRELAELSNAFSETEDSLRPLYLKGLGAGPYTLRIELGWIELPGGVTEPVIYEKALDFTTADITDLKLKISQSALISEALLRSETR